MRTFFIILLFILSPVWVISQEVPTRNEVGASRLPDTIAPIVAPFNMPQLVPPMFPDRTVSITAKGAKQGKLSTSAIQKAIDELSRKGGGTVVVPAWKWFAGRITLKSNINLRLDENAELHFSGEIKDYLPVVFTRNEGIEMYSLGALIYANGAENIAITGKGKLIGPGNKCEIFREHRLETSIEYFVPDTIPTEKRIYDGKDGRIIFLPMFFAPVHSSNILVEGVTFENSIFWNIVPQYCENIIIRGVTVNSAGHARTDGIDIESSRNALIEYCTLNCGDDCFTIKSGRGEDGLRANRPSENIVVRYSWAQKGAGSVTCGSETAGMIRNVYVHDCVFDGTHNGILFKTRRPRGGGGENLYYERIRLNIPGPAIKWDMLGSKRWVGDLADRVPAQPFNELTPIYRDIIFRNIVVENCRQLIDLIGIPESPVTGVLINRMDAKCDKLVKLQDTDGFVITNSTIRSSCDSVSITDGRNIMFVNVKFSNPQNEVKYNYSGELARPVLVE